jgi:hypothetical protein
VIFLTAADDSPYDTSRPEAPGRFPPHGRQSDKGEYVADVTAGWLWLMKRLRLEFGAIDTRLSLAGEAVPDTGQLCQYGHC